MVKTRKLPSSREKKRYIVVEVISESAIKNPTKIRKAILDYCYKYIGEFGVEKAKLRVFEERYNSKNQRIIIRTTTKTMYEVKKILNMINKIDNKQVKVRTIGVSGMIKKAYEKYVIGEN